MDTIVCHTCIGDEFVKARIKEEGSVGRCSYCKARRKAVPLTTLADWVDEVYREHYHPGEEVPEFDADDHVSYNMAGDSPADIIAEDLEVDGDLASDVADELSHREEYDVVKEGGIPLYACDWNYEFNGTSGYQHSELWRDFCDTVKHTSRFYNASATKILEELLSGVADMKCTADQQPIRSIGPSTAEKVVFRARRAKTDGDVIRIAKSAHQELGPPPKSKTTAGRMNAAGIPVFYGALDEKTAVAEIRLPVGGEAVVAKFEIIRPLRVLDLTVFKHLYEGLSLFDPQYESKASHQKFLREFEEVIGEPVSPGGEQLDYIPTQALAEYLANICTPRFDAVIYSSTQLNGGDKNIVILSHAASVEWPDDGQQQPHETPYRLTKTDDSCWISDNSRKPKKGPALGWI